MRRAVSIWFCLMFFPFFVMGQNKIVIPDLHKLSASINTGSVNTVEVDTLITGSQQIHPLYKKYPGWSELGNPGLPAIPLRYYGIGKTSTPMFLVPYLNYSGDSDQIYIYNTKGPFSQISYSSEITGDKKKEGQILNFFYTRNVGSDINITGLFDFVSSTGHYSNQAATLSTLGLRMSVEKSRYKHYSSLERLQFKLQENGGVVDDGEVTSIQGSFLSTVAVNLTNSSSITGILRLKGWQYLDILKVKDNGPADSLSESPKKMPLRPVLIHSYEYTRGKRIYKDKPGQSSFYQDWLIDQETTEDSLQHYSFVNDINLRIKGIVNDSAFWIAEAGFHHELLHWYSYQNSIWEQSMGIGGLTAINFKKLVLLGKARLMFAGYEAGDHLLELSARYSAHENQGGPALEFHSRAVTPDLFVQNYFGNNFSWTNDFSRQNEQGIGFSWDFPGLGISADFEANVISNWIYFNKDARPAQRESAAIMLSGGIGKSFSAGPFRSRNTVHINYTEAEEIPLPLAVASSSTFMHHDIHFKKTQGLLQLEYGFDIRYTTEYKGYAYMPASGVFYLQDEKILGNYPVIDLFLIMRVKRTRFFVRWDHINSGFTGDNIFPVLHYPVKQRFLNYGVYWHFHD